MSPVVVDSQGNAYLMYSVVQMVSNSAGGLSPSCSDPAVTSFFDTLSLMKIAPNGSSSVQTLFTSTTSCIFPVQLIPDGQGGVLAAWVSSLAGSHGTPGPVNVTHVTAGGTTGYQLPLTFQFTFPQQVTMVLGENGNGFATEGAKIVSFDLTSGQVQWSYSGPSLSIIASAAGNSLIAKTTDQNAIDTVLRFDSSGTATPDTWTGSSIDYWAGDLWTSTSSGVALKGHSAVPIQSSATAWFSPDQSGTKQAASRLIVGSPSSSGPNQTAISTVFGKIKNALDADATSSNPKCSNWLQGGGTTGSILIGVLLANNNFGHGVFSIQSIAAVHGIRNLDGSPTGIPGNFAITVNDLGAYFQTMNVQGNSFSIGKRHYPGNTLRAQATILIHEVAHALPAPQFQDDNGKPKAGKANDKLVDNNCRYLIEGLQ
jgi:hypothetical protein